MTTRHVAPGITTSAANHAASLDVSNLFFSVELMHGSNAYK